MLQPETGQGLRSQTLGGFSHLWEHFWNMSALVGNPDFTSTNFWIVFFYNNGVSGKCLVLNSKYMNHYQGWEA